MFKFTIRDLLWLTVVVALGVALWIQTRRYEEAAQEAKNRTVENDYWLKQVLALEEKVDAQRRKARVPNSQSPAGELAP